MEPGKIRDSVAHEKTSRLESWRNRDPHIARPERTETPHGREILVELEPGKTLVVKLLTVSNAHPDGTRTIFFELNGQPREGTIRDNALRATVQVWPKADPSAPGQVGAPIPGSDFQLRRRAGTTSEAGRPAAHSGSNENAIDRLRPRRRQSSEEACERRR